MHRTTRQNFRSHLEISIRCQSTDVAKILRKGTHIKKNGERKTGDQYQILYRYFDVTYLSTYQQHTSLMSLFKVQIKLNRSSSRNKKTEGDYKTKYDVA